MTAKAFTPKDIAKQGLARLRAKADPRKARDVQKYFKETVKSYGVSSPDIRAIAADLYAAIKKDWTVADAIRLCNIVFPELELEAKAIGALILARFKKEFPKSLFDKVKSWLAANRLDNWASVDVFCPDVVGALIVMYPEFEEKIKSWAGHPNRWSSGPRPFPSSSWQKKRNIWIRSTASRDRSFPWTMTLSKRPTAGC